MLTAARIWPNSLGADGMYGYFGVHDTVRGGYFLASRYLSATMLVPVIPCPCTTARNPFSTFTCSAVCASADPTAMGLKL